MEFFSSPLFGINLKDDTVTCVMDFVFKFNVYKHVYLVSSIHCTSLKLPTIVLQVLHFSLLAFANGIIRNTVSRTCKSITETIFLKWKAAASFWCPIIWKSVHSYESTSILKIVQKKICSNDYATVLYFWHGVSEYYSCKTHWKSNDSSVLPLFPHVVKL